MRIDVDTIIEKSRHVDRLYNEWREARAELERCVLGLHSPPVAVPLPIVELPETKESSNGGDGVSDKVIRTEAVSKNGRPFGKSLSAALLHLEHVYPEWCSIDDIWKAVGNRIDVSRDAFVRRILHLKNNNEVEHKAKTANCSARYRRAPQ